MFVKRDPFGTGTTVGAWLSLAFLSVTFAWIGIAYGAQLNTQNSVAKFTPNIFSTDTSQSFTEPDGTIRSTRFLGDLLKAADSDRNKLLWAMYPASIRGRVFSGATVIGTPLESVRGGGGGGGGW